MADRPDALVTVAEACEAVAHPMEVAELEQAQEV